MDKTEARDREPTITVRRESAAAPAAEPRGVGENGFLLVLEASASRLVPLPAAGQLTIGRAPDCQVRVASPAVSRAHALIELVTEAQGPRVRDLGSHNGTYVNGERVQGVRPLQPGDTIGLCDVSVLFFARAVSTARPLHPEPSFLLDRLDEEIERAGNWQRAVALLALESPAVLPPLAPLASALGGALRLSDVAALDGPQRLLILRPDCDGPGAAQAAQALLQSLAAVAPGLRAGHAVFPSDGPRGAVLLDAARAAAARAASGKVEPAGAATTTLRIGEREILVADPAMVHLYGLLQRLAPSELSVLICGETGTGKELAAQALHALSPRRRERLVSINCAALPESLAESELFGHERGAFSGAVASKVGLLEAAQGGTVFLDEVGELSLTVQAKLLRALEARQLLRVGDTRERPFQARVIAATNRDLEQEIAKGRFRQDLYFRIASAVLHLPPLRARPRELPILARAFLREARLRAGMAPALLSAAAEERLLAYAWPGNVRELKNAMDYAAAIAADDVIEPEQLPPALLKGTRPPASAGSAGGAPSLPELARVLIRAPLGDRIAAIERALIEEALGQAAGNKSAAARLLGVHRKVIERWLVRQGSREDPD